MPCFSPDARRLFDDCDEGDLLDNLEGFYEGLLERRKAAVPFGDLRKLEERERTTRSLDLLQQVQLHRAERLLAAASLLLPAGNAYSIALVVRGFYESTAVLGYFCSRLESLSRGSIQFDDFQWEVADAVMGARHSTFTKARAPLQILTCLDRADKYLDKHLFKEKHRVLRDGYDWLSEFAHPNFLSNVCAFRVDRERECLVLRHGEGALSEDIELLSYLGICAPIFTWLYESLSQRSADCSFGFD